MWQGQIEGLFIATAANEPMQAVDSVRAIPGQGLEGDRYFNKVGTFSATDNGDREVTLIEVEAYEALDRDYDIQLALSGSRRNIVTRGVPLNHLVGQEFQIGTVRMRGVRLCEPCDTLAKATEQGVLKGLVHRGGLRAQILTEGVLRVGDSITRVTTLQP